MGTLTPTIQATSKPSLVLSGTEMAVVDLRSYLLVLFWTSLMVVYAKFEPSPSCLPPSFSLESENGQVEMPLPEVRPLGATLGAQVLHIDLSQKLSSSQQKILQEAFDQMTVEESAPLKQFLISWVSRAEHVYRHQWKEGDLVMWDNRATLHYGVYDYGPEQARLMHRTTASGERPY